MSISRRRFITTVPAAGAALAALPAGGQGVSLAAWSFSGSFFQGRWKLLELPGILRDRLRITALEHVNQFFENPTLTYLQRLRKACTDAGVESTILMVDSEGATAHPDRAERRLAAAAHRKWIDIAQYLNCKSVRFNVYGGAPDWKKDTDLVSRAAETIQSMLEYASGSGLDLIVENHGGASSDPD